jgi:hypothetical protein
MTALGNVDHMQPSSRLALSRTAINAFLESFSSLSQYVHMHPADRRRILFRGADQSPAKLDPSLPGE